MTVGAMNDFASVGEVVKHVAMRTANASARVDHVTGDSHGDCGHGEVGKVGEDEVQLELCYRYVLGVLLVL